MVRRLLIDKIERNILFFSDFIKKNEPEIFNILSENEKINEKKAKENNILQKIKQNRAAWLNFSTKEWVADKRNPHISKNDREKKHCDLCNSEIKYQYKMKNINNNKEIVIGGNCLDNFKQLKSMKKLIRNEDDYEEYNKLLEEYPQIYDILTVDSNFLDDTEIILPHNYYESFKTIQNKITKEIKKCIKKRSKLDNEKFDELLKTYNFEKGNTEDFILKNQKDANFLSRKSANEIKIEQNDEYQEIIESVQKNKGQLSPDIFSRIKVKSHLEKARKYIELQIPKSVKITEVKFGSYVIKIQKFNDIYMMEVESKFLIDSFYKRKLVDFSDLYLSNMDKFNMVGDTKEKLAILSESFILSAPSLSLEEIKHNKIVHLYDNDLQGKEYNRVAERVIRIIQKYTCFKKKGSNTLLVYNNRDLAMKGKELLFSQSDKTKKKIIDSFAYEFTVNQFYYWVLEQLE